MHSNVLYLEPLDGISLGDLVLVTDLAALRLPLRHAVSGAVEHYIKVHSVDTYSLKTDERTKRDRTLDKNIVLCLMRQLHQTLSRNQKLPRVFFTAYLCAVEQRLHVLLFGRDPTRLRGIKYNRP